MGLSSFRRTRPQALILKKRQALKARIHRPGLDFAAPAAYQKKAGQCWIHRPAGAVPRVSQLPRRKLKVFAPVRMVLPTGATSLLVKMTNNERYQNASQHICRHVQQELHHRHHLLSEACPVPLILQNFPAFNAAFPS